MLLSSRVADLGGATVESSGYRRRSRGTRSGNRSKPSSGIGSHGAAYVVNWRIEGRTPGSPSNAPRRTPIGSSWLGSPPNRAEPHSPQNHFPRPVSGFHALRLSSPCRMRRLLRGTNALAEAPAPVRRWHLWQWQYRATAGRWASSKRTAPQLQPPVRGRSVIDSSFNLTFGFRSDARGGTRTPDTRIMILARARGWSRTHEISALDCGIASRRLRLFAVRPLTRSVTLRAALNRGIPSTESRVEEVVALNPLAPLGDELGCCADQSFAVAIRDIGCLMDHLITDIR